MTAADNIVRASWREPMFGIKNLQLAAVCGIAFILPAANGRPAFFSSGLFCMLLAFVLLVLQLRSRSQLLILRRSDRAFAYVLLLWVLGAVLSTVLNPTALSITALVFGYCLPFAIFLLLSPLKFDEAAYRTIFTALASGLCLRFAHGAYAYITSWGIPSFSEIATNRYHMNADDPYMLATFGNPGNTASLLTICLAVMVPVFVMVQLGRMQRVLVGFAIGICVLNLLMSGSRTGVVITAMVSLGAVVYARGWRKIVVAILVPIVLGVFLVNLDYDFVERLLFAATLDQASDNSVDERLASIRIGIDLLVSHPFGIGPAMGPEFNPYSVAHQLMINQGNEAGILGLVATTLILPLSVFRCISCWKEAKRGKDTERFIFSFGALTWIIYGMVANIVISTGFTIAWIGVLVLFSSMSGKEVCVLSHPSTRSTR